jgi:hypothetical protein
LFTLAEKAKVDLCVARFDVLYLQIFPEGIWEGKIAVPVLCNFGTRLGLVMRITSHSLHHDGSLHQHTINTRLGSVIRITSHSLHHEENRPQHTINMMPNWQEKQSGHNERTTIILPLWNRITIIRSLHSQPSGFSGLLVSMLASGTKVCGFKPG